MQSAPVLEQLNGYGANCIAEYLYTIRVPAGSVAARAGNPVHFASIVASGEVMQYAEEKSEVSGWQVPPLASTCYVVEEGGMLGNWGPSPEEAKHRWTTLVNKTYLSPSACDMHII